ncbi:hypothetical protein CEB3_c10840 [Peptococcaceae bacterium CEB3]|nr:hypothetical protein CEB3_c10840 [Peptococcaceae bacterium CEB3]
MMFLGRSRFQGTAGAEAAEGNVMEGAPVGAGAAMPLGLQRFLNKKGITSQEDLMNRINTGSPRLSWRRPS